MHQNITEILNRLNTEQRQAVDEIEGPVMVIAGPGTGKTEILASRICNILTTTDTTYESVLCLTFTDAGSIAMRKRLLKYLGSDAHKIPIYTFHSFCNSIIQENKDYFSMKVLEPISEIEKFETIIEIIDEIPADNVLKRWTGEIYYEANRILKLISVMKSEGFTSEFFKEKSNEYLEEIKTRDEFKYKRAVPSKGIVAGDLKVNEINEIQQRLSKLIAASELFPKYEEKLSKRSRYDFQDMLSWVIKAFNTYPELLLKYQEKFLYVLVDEFQDTNNIQAQLVHKLMEYWGDQANLFVVGDDDQSIYRFQGASIENVLSFKEKYPSAKTVLLKQNYRSTQEILNAAQALISANKERLVNTNLNIDKNLYSPIDHKDSCKPQVLSFQNSYYEASYFANEIKKWIETGTSPDEIAIIYRNHGQVDVFIEAFTSLQIPFNLKKSQNVLEDSCVSLLVIMILYIDAELTHPFSGEDKMFQILHYAGFEIPSTLIAEFVQEINTKRSGNKRLSWRSYANEFQSEGLFSLNAKFQKIVSIIKEFDLLISEANHIRLMLVIQRLIEVSNCIDSILVKENKITELNAIRTFIDFVKEQTISNPDLSLKQFVELLKNMNRFKITIPFVQTIGTTKGVNLLTAHSSKGLEFEKVIIVSAAKDIWESSKPIMDWIFPENIVPHYSSGNKIEEERRLFYVAMTRAKSNLFISYTEKKTNDKASERSLFVDELLDTDTVNFNPIQVEDELVLPVFLQGLLPQNQAELYLPDKEIVEKYLQSYKLSVTHLNTYLRCPKSFYYNYIIQVPAMKNAAMEFGSAVHEMLYRYFKKVVETSLFPPVNEMIELFEYELSKRRSAFTDKELNHKLEYGKTFIPKYYENGVSKWSKILALERNVQAVVNGIPIKGIIDKIEFNGNEATVIDYKTGKHEYAKTKFKRPGEQKDKQNFENEFGGDYWRQAVFYKILIDNYEAKNWKVNTTIFDFVEPDSKSNKFNQEKVVIQSEDLQIVRNQIEIAYNKIMNMEFSKKCNEEDCYWCSFEKRFQI